MESFNFAKLETKFLGSRGRKLANNTVVVQVSADEYAIRLHSTNIVTFHRDGRIVLNSGGWQTSTTKARINDAIGVFRGHVSQKNFAWTLHTFGNEPREFFDGITL